MVFGLRPANWFQADMVKFFFLGCFPDNVLSLWRGALPGLVAVTSNGWQSVNDMKAMAALLLMPSSASCPEESSFLMFSTREHNTRRDSALTHKDQSGGCFLRKVCFCLR